MKKAAQPQRADGSKIGVSNRIRTGVASRKGRSPRPLDDGHHSGFGLRATGSLSLRVRPAWLPNLDSNQGPAD